MPSSPPARPVAVLDACVLVPAGLRDLLLSLADTKAFRPVWQDDILAETQRNAAKVLVKQGVPSSDSASRSASTVAVMQSAFSDARLQPARWKPLVPEMTNHTKDRHVLAAAVGAKATHLVTENMKDFPPASRRGVLVQRPDAFMLDLLATHPLQTLAGVEAMASRHSKPPHTAPELAQKISTGERTSRFGAALLEMLETGTWSPSITS